MRPSRLLIFLTATAIALSSAFVFTGTGLGADTATPALDTEGWFDRFRDEDVQADPTPVCPVVTLSGQPCGPISPGDNPEPRSKTTGQYVVASAGGDAGDRTETGGDTGWAAFVWDMFDYEEATVEKFVVTFSLAQDNGNRNQGDTYTGTGTEAAPPIQACNVLESWGSETGPNAWAGRPKASDECLVPTNEKGERTTSGRQFRFDLTRFAQTWVEGKGFGIIIRPGTPEIKTNIQPFQITISGYYDAPANSSGCSAPNTIPTTTAPCTTTSPTAPNVEFAFTPAEDDFDDIGFDDGGELFEEISTPGDEGVLQAVPDLDVIPDDAGSEPLPEEAAAGAEPPTDLAAPTTGRRARPISTDTSFPWAVLLLLPVVAAAFWSTGTALGPVGDPVPARRGGVSRVLAERQAASRGSDLKTRNR